MAESGQEGQLTKVRYRTPSPEPASDLGCWRVKGARLPSAPLAAPQTAQIGLTIVPNISEHEQRHFHFGRIHLDSSGDLG